MAFEKSPLKVILAPIAIDELHDIWRWNAEHYTPAHADAYVRFLKRMIDDLAHQYVKGKPVAKRLDLRYILIRRKSKGHGHVAVYRFDAARVDVLHIFHTAQDWPARLLENDE